MECVVYECFEASLEVSFPVEPAGSVVDDGWVEVVVGGEDDVDGHLSEPSWMSALSILKLEGVEIDWMDIGLLPLMVVYRFHHRHIP